MPEAGLRGQTDHFIGSAVPIIGAAPFDDLEIEPLLERTGVELEVLSIVIAIIQDVPPRQPINEGQIQPEPRGQIVVIVGRDREG